MQGDLIVGNDKQGKGGAMSSRRHYACRPPGVHHGPFTSQAAAASCYEIHYYETSGMLKTGSEHLESLRDGRVVYIGSERVDDVTTHPGVPQWRALDGGDLRPEARRPAVQLRGEGGERFSAYFLRAQDQGRSSEANRASSRDRRP